MSALGWVLLVSGAISSGLAWWLWDLQRRSPGPEALEIFGRLFVHHDAPAALLFLPILALACSATLQRCGLRLASALGERPNLVAALSFGVFALAARFIYQAHPLSLDEYAPLFQSELFASGRLFATAPVPLLDFLVPRDMQAFFFSVSHESGRVASGYWPGFALLLTPFTWLGVPWLLNPLIGALTLRLLHHVALATLGTRELAGLAVLIALGSSALTINAASLYAMPAHALLNLAFGALVAAPTPGRALAAGLCGGLSLTLHNPLPHALFAAPWIAWLSLRSDRSRVLPALALGYLPLAVLLGAGWSALLARELGASGGSAARTGELSAFFALPNAAIAVARLVGFAKLWLWTAPATLTLALLGLHAARRDPRLALWAASAVLTALAYFFVPFDQGHGWGNRYFHSAWCALPLLAAAAIGARSDEGARTLAGFAAACALASAVLLTPLRALQVHGFITAHLAQLPRAERGAPDLVLVDTSAGYYSIDLVQNHPSFARRPLRMEWLGDEATAEMRRRFFPGLVLLARNERGEVWGRPDRKLR